MTGLKKSLKKSLYKMVYRYTKHIRFSYSLLAMALFVLGCEQPIKKEEDTQLEHDTEIRIHNIKKDDVEILMIDGCEYIVYKESDGANRAYGYMSHKGNCINPIHCQNEIK
ncbi:hypothetical protein [Tenacibaculum aquimarinum]|uniref:hypothetical protein n=1 Tax=Tenacibaculum aquimarinum TaxID=2910675 RepID=UPI001F0A67C3|nr:hypothetical protein [Tenacibaculum aquimarinum]MCH3884511.1 hypothetical protein [Tenacibaculum aquimarinum]